MPTPEKAITDLQEATYIEETDYFLMVVNGRTRRVSLQTLREFLIDDTVTTTTKTWSSNKIDSELP